MTIEKGGIYWIEFPPLEKGGSSVPHPHVVIQDTVINQSRIDTVVVCGITTNMKKRTWPGNVPLETGEANLPKRSLVDVSQVAAVSKELLGEYIGRLSDRRLEQIFEGMRLVQSLSHRQVIEE